ncbi:Mov34/MPN/PAD-1 family protein [Cupriavidus basilensis]|uniref:Mov34/MPN/PAD-1 family protein n=1 Tax=Cupriavidus basilensis TaxID=68895 RepID=UPI0034596C7C
MLLTEDVVFRSRFGAVSFSAECLAVFTYYQQAKATSREAGGQLFGDIADLRTMRIRVATGPTRGAVRTRYSYQPDRRQENREIAAYHKKGLHYLGDWHSHPEPHPTPSASDTEKLAAILGQSRHDLNCLLMVIVGTSELPGGLWVSTVTAGANEQALREQWPLDHPCTGVPS